MFFDGSYDPRYPLLLPVLMSFSGVDLLNKGPSWGRQPHKTVK